MPPRRRKYSTSTDGSRADEDYAAPTPKRRRAAIQYDPLEICQDLFDTVRNHRTEDGKVLCEAFIRAPNKRTDPEYYNVVSTPIDMLKIQHKIRSEEYDEIDQLTADIELLVENTKAYYTEETQEYKDACALWDLYNDTKAVLLTEVFGEDVTAKSDAGTKDDTGDDASSNATVEEDDNQYEQLFTALVLAKEGGREICEMFKLLPSKTAYPEYFQVIKNPIDLKMIAQKVQDNKYKSLDDMVKDLTLMVNNAKLFNEPGSQIYKDAQLLKKVIHSRRNEIETQRHMRAKSSERIRTRSRAPGGRSMSAVFASYEYDSEDTTSQVEEEEDDKMDDRDDQNMDEDDEDSQMSNSLIQSPQDSASSDNPYWSLYKYIVSYTNATHNTICEPFMRLPNKRIYPDYYEDIKQPLSLLNIKKKLKFNQYRSLESLATDLELVFSNAMSYNIEESQLFKDAQTLKHAAQKRFTEMAKQPVGPQSHFIMAADAPPLQPTSFASLVSSTTSKPSTTNVVPVKRGRGRPKGSCNKRGERSLERYEHPVYSRYPQRYTPASSGSYLEIVTGPIPLQQYLQELEGTEIAIKSTPARGRRSADISPNSGRRRLMTPEEHLVKRLNLLYRTVYDYKDNEGRSLIPIFVELPLKKEYPDYYQVISEPIDMTIIENKIKANKYRTDQELINDFELMFNNARHYNEEHSQVYQDANTLERVLRSKVRTLVPLDSPKRAFRGPGRPRYSKFMTPLAQKLQELYNTIKDFHDSRGRILSTPFIKLPSRNEYPDYYEVIKRPIDMTKIQHRLQHGTGHNPYESLEDMVADFVLMFDNACKYNEPDSLIYKDALTLQRICLEKAGELNSHEDKNNVPDVKHLVQQLMTNLFVATYNHADEDGRCYSDSFADMPASEPSEGSEEVNTKRRIPTFEQVKRNLDRGRYRRVDRFQEDMFEVFEHARKVSRSDSQLYEDAVELQMYFIKTRDELCKNGETMLTPALSLTSSILHKEVEAERRDKVSRESKEDQADAVNKEEGEGEDAMIYKDQTYKIGDFVYVEPRKRKRGRPPKNQEREKELEPHIVCIEKMWQGEAGEQTFSGCWFYRPKETYHVAHKKFLEKEVFKSDFYEPVSFNRIMGKCYVMNVKDYFKMKPEGFADKDVYVCESRYNCRQRAFKKIKVWTLPKNAVKLLAREKPLVPVRVASVFADKGPSQVWSDEIPEGEPFYLDRKRENVTQDVDTSDGNTYYEQLKTAAGWFKLGDHVYVRSDEDRPYIARIDKMWTDNGNNMYFHGPWYVHPQDVQHSPTRLFYRQEVFRSTIEDTNPMLSIQGRCCVLSPKEYCTSRPTEILEHDIYICESKYNETEKAIKKIPKATAVKKAAYISTKVIDDEYYFFRKPISPGREPSPLLIKASDDAYLDGYDAPATPSNMSHDGHAPSTPSEPPLSEDNYSEKGDKVKKKKSSKPWQPSGYLVFSAETRKAVQDANPDLSFGEISKLVGQRWREMEDHLKSNYEEKAKKLAEEHAAKQEAAEKAFNDSLSSYPRSQSPASPAPARPAGYSGPGYPLTSHAHQQQTPPITYASNQGPPVPSPAVTPGPYPIHVMGGYQQMGYAPQGYYPPQYTGARPMPPAHPALLYYNTDTSAQNMRGSSQGAVAVPPRPPSPVFVAVPPRTQRLVHSEAYLRYIEGLDKDTPYVSNWEKTMIATQENTPLERNARLPTHWLSQGAGHHGDTVSALWALRDLMLRDTLTVCRTLDITEM